MCGIAGIITFKENKAPLQKQELLQHLHTMTNAIAHRGPDGDGHWASSDNTIGLGHRRLSIIDLSESAAQPMQYMSRYTITYNGEIYNYIELKDHLYKNGYRFITKSDTEVILAAYDHWKEECLQKFDGMFSFAIWDKQENTFFAARDRFGEKPFFYYSDAGQFIFASEMKALWAVGVPKRTDKKMLLNFITLGHVQNVIDKAATFFENIYSLPPAHYIKIIISGNKHHKTHDQEIKRYWKIDKEFFVKISEKDAIEKFDSLFNTSVKRRMRSDVPVGTSLSGGLDSASIIEQINTSKFFGSDNALATFSAVFPGFEKDESRYIHSVVKNYGLNNFQVTPDANELIDDFERLCYHQEEPFTSSSIYAQYKVYELAEQHSIKVLLDGQGADETLAGYHKYFHWYLQQILSRGKIFATQREVNAIKKNKIPLQWNIKNILAAYFPPHTTVMMEKRDYLTINYNSNINTDFVRSLRGREWEGIRKPVITKLNDILYFNTSELGLEELLRYADRNSMAHGREVRLPFLSHELVEFVFSLPAQYKIHEGWTKWILRKTMDKRLPDEIVWRTDKIGYEPPQLQWMQTPALHEYIHEAKRKLVNQGILKEKILDQNITPRNAHDAGNYDWRYLCAAQMI